jgi:hypothetical protein
VIIGELVQCGRVFDAKGFHAHEAELAAEIVRFVAVKLKHHQAAMGHRSGDEAGFGIHEDADAHYIWWELLADLGCLFDGNEPWAFFVKHQADCVRAGFSGGDRIFDIGDSANFYFNVHARTVFHSGGENPEWFGERAGRIAAKFVETTSSNSATSLPMVIPLGFLTFDFDMVRDQPWLAIPFAFQLWMLIDAIRRDEMYWAAFIFFFPVVGAVWYFFSVYRGTASSATTGFELPGVHDRRRIKELQAQIHHLDKPHHHLALGDIYFQQGKLDKAEVCYRASLERDASDIDTRAHLGQCLLRKKKPAEARPLLQQVCAENPRHDYGYSLMAYAETLTAVGEVDAAICAWKQVLQNNSYARARVQLAELYIGKNQRDLARSELQTAIADDAHCPSFQRKRDRVWIRRAKRLLRTV